MDPKKELKRKNYKFGCEAEAIVIKFLESKKFEIVARRYKKIGIGEIDIVAKNLMQKQIVFVEVKARSGLYSQNMLDNAINSSLNIRQIRRYCAAAQNFIASIENGLIKNLSSIIVKDWQFRYDFAFVGCVMSKKTAKIMHWSKNITEFYDFY